MTAFTHLDATTSSRLLVVASTMVPSVSVSVLAVAVLSDAAGAVAWSLGLFAFRVAEGRMPMVAMGLRT